MKIWKANHIKLMYYETSLNVYSSNRSFTVSRVAQSADLFNLVNAQVDSQFLTRIYI